MNWIIRSIILVILLVWGTQIQALSGPMQPEVTQFEPVDGTDMVNLSSGDFSYVLSLLEVPGPDGGYPIAMNYHAGIGLNQDATWVGLGWSLSPGSINRIVNGYPDDYSNGGIKTRQHAIGSSWGVGIQIGVGPIGMNVNFNSNNTINCGASIGFLSINSDGSAGVNVNGVQANFNSKGIQSVGYMGAQIGFNSHGVSSIGYDFAYSLKNSPMVISGGINYNLDKEKMSYSVGVSNPIMSYSISSQGRSSTTINGVGFSASNTSSGKAQISTNSFSLPPITIGPVNIGLSFSQVKWKIDEKKYEHGYGYIKQSDFYPNRNTIDLGSKYERNKPDPDEDLLYESKDCFQVNSQGLSGSFNAYFTKPYMLHDENDDYQNAQLENTILGNEYIQDDVQFRFISDVGNNLITQDNLLAGHQYNSLISGRYASDVIIPITSEQTSGISMNADITGFRIIKTDGLIYEFYKPCYSYIQYSKTWKTTETSNYAESGFNTPFATSWLITSIKGPDYVDRNNNGIVDGNDWGYWIKFNYTNAGLECWRTPFYGSTTSAGHDSEDDDYQSISNGVRDEIYLQSIETASHIAEFQTSDRNDRQSKENMIMGSTEISNLDDVIRISSFSNNIQFDEQTRIETLTFSFTGNYLFLNSHLPDQIIAEMEYQYHFAEGTNSYPIMPYQFTRNELQITYDPITNTTNFTNTRTLGSEDAPTMKIMYCYLRLPADDPLNSDLYNVAQKLDCIRLFKKGCSEPMNTIEFNYSYSLCQNTPSSSIAGGTTHYGKLTLLSIIFKGRNGVLCSPPYEFSYNLANNNPNFSEDNWDRWGSYRAPASGDTGFSYHMTPQDKVRADKASAWSLSEIYTPTGTKFYIEYESDDYYYVEDDIDFTYAQYCTVSGFNNSSNSVTINNPDLLNNEYDPTINPNEIYIFSYWDKYNVSGQNIGYGNKSITKNHISAIDGKIITLAEDYTFLPASSIESIPPYIYRNVHYKIVFSPKQVYGGGIRAKRISLNSTSHSIKIDYSYQLQNGFSSGTVCTLPVQYQDTEYETFDSNSFFSNEDYAEDTIKYNQRYISHKYGYYRKPPSVIYSKVVVKYSNSNDTFYNGRAEYNFYTSKDYPFGVEYNSTDHLLSIHDKSAIYGQPKSTMIYEKTPSGNYRKISETNFKYVFSSDQDEQDPESNSARYPRVTEYNIAISNNDNPIGIIQEKYAYRKHDHSTNIVDRVVDNVYQVGSTNISYYYPETDDETTTSLNKFQTINYTTELCALSGIGLTTATFNSDNTASITKNYPAYWYNPEMKTDKNMLTQVSLVNNYRPTNIGFIYCEGNEGIKDDDFNYHLLTNYTFPNSDFKSSQATIWSNDFDIDNNGNPDVYESFTWAKQSTYNYIGLPQNFPDFNSGYWFDGLPNSTLWERTSNITRINRFSQPIEEKGNDGVKSCIIYDDNDFLPIGLITNAGLASVYHTGFESSTSNWTGGTITAYTDNNIAHTGNNVLEISPSSNSSHIVYSLPVGKYKLSAWFKAPPGRTVTLACQNGSQVFQQSELGNSKWKNIVLHFTVTYEDNYSIKLINGSTAYSIQVDDIRLHPINANMTTYAYDPVTDKLTSITDANDLVTYFKYDNAGKLIQVLDHNHKIRSMSSYHYGRIEEGLQ
jgi:hypothetical protein